ncbi:LacI family DNA-binding transcriptional regulator [uncultured Alsobacter sp.]|uniref:LacI family DNA-binding transcriptional regulator n=1 Tax=uncultured Alsobacter sp. TaxID=1748258 RepID=UPI0025E72228|nr:LacI family DNA-binding transcriptional regulator [uncultured Alsobacter sp.]
MPVRLRRMKGTLVDDKVRGRPDAPVSLADLANEAGVSISTVSRIVNGQIHRASPKTVARIQTLVKELGYRTNHAGRSLRRGDSRLVAMLAPNIDNPAMAAIAASTEAALRKAGYVMILCDTHDRADLQDEYLQAMRAQVAHGYVMVSSVRSPELSAAVERGDPMVFVGRRSPYGPAAYVGIDNRQAGADAADHLLALGLDRPAVLRPAVLSNSIADRVEGFLDRLAERGVPRKAIRIARGDGASHLDFGYDAAKALVAKGGWPAAIMCPSDLMAYGAYRLAHEQGIDVPGACRIVGIDENALNAWIAPWLTSIRIPYKDYGASVVEQLQALWAGQAPPERLLPHELVVR